MPAHETEDTVERKVRTDRVERRQEESNPEDKQSLKRLVALYRDMQWNNEAIALLNKYTECN